MKKKYKINPTKKQLDVMQRYWDELRKVEGHYFDMVNKIETAMAMDTGIKGIEFIKDEWIGGGWVGIGNAERTMKLVVYD